MELAPTRTAKQLEPAERLDELTDRVRDLARDHVDHPEILLGETRFEESGHWRYNGEAGPLSRHALGQLCARLSLPGGGTVPAGYLARCPSPLAVEHLNYWLEQPGPGRQQVLVRTRTGPEGVPAIRAVLSPRYAKADHLVVLQALGRVILRYGLNVSCWALDDEQMTLRLTVVRDHPASLDDPLRIGLHVSNSEVGLGRIAITAFITRLVCSNGLVVRVADLGGLQRRHIGRAGESLSQLVDEGIGPVLEQADTACERLAQLREVPVPEPVEQYLERLTRRLELPERVTEYATRYLQGETLYEVLNAFTRAAQEFPVAERVQIETNISQLLDRRRWS